MVPLILQLINVAVIKMFISRVKFFLVLLSLWMLVCIAIVFRSNMFYKISLSKIILWPAFIIIEGGKGCVFEVTTAVSFQITMVVFGLLSRSVFAPCLLVVGCLLWFT